MKTKLLRKLRRKFYIEHIHSSGNYRLTSRDNLFHFTILECAKKTRNRHLLEHARTFYSKYAKKTKLI